MESADGREVLVAHLEGLGVLLKALTGVVDVRGVFARVSEIASRAVPHDAIGLPLVTEDGEHLMPFGTAGLSAGVLPERRPVDDGFRRLMAEPWDWHILDDVQTARPDGVRGRLLDGDQEYVTLGCRAFLRVPIRIDGKLIGILGFFAKAPGVYSRSHALLASRIADHVALAIAHLRLAEEKKKAEALRERTANLELLDDLLATLTDVLDIRGVFDRLSQVTQRVLPHDVVGVLNISESGDLARLHVTAGLPDGTLRSHEAVALDPETLKPLWDPLIVDDVPAHPLGQYGPAAEAGLKSAVSAPIRFGGRLRGAVSFLSRQAARFSRDDLLIVQRIARHIALAMSHHSLAEEAHQRRVLEERAAALVLLEQSLASLTDAGTPTEVFERISGVARSVLPHDACTLRVLTPDGVRASAFVSVGLDATRLPTVVEPLPPEFARDADWDHELVDDLAARPEPLNRFLAEQGFRSALRLLVHLERSLLGVFTFLARTPSQYEPTHVQVARSVAGRMAISIEREHARDQAKRADEASERASRLESRVRALTDELDARTSHRRVLGESRPWRQVLTQAAQVAATDTTVLLLGESGTGKEVVARLIHRGSARSEGPFVALNCAALPEHLLEAELFGFERGAFTGATQSKPGQIEQAGGGVLFLDEVGEMAPSVQAKFLRVLQEREFQRLGGTRVLRANVRVVAATNRDLAKAIERGAFREDLYYRLNVFPITLPALRDRRDDILPMTEAFMQEIGRTLGRPPAGLARDARQVLLDYHWPGNVRELRNMIERAAILADGGLILGDHFAMVASPRAATPLPAIPAPPAESAAVPSDIATMERAMIERALRDARFNKAKAAKTLGLTRGQLYGRLKRLGLE